MRKHKPTVKSVTKKVNELIKETEPKRKTYKFNLVEIDGPCKCNCLRCTHTKWVIYIDSVMKGEWFHIVACNRMHKIELALLDFFTGSFSVDHIKLKAYRNKD